MLSSLLFLSLSCTALAAPRPISRRDADPNKIRGVNLGGWLVLEPFITPSLFDATADSRIVDELTFGQFQDRDKAQAALIEHWDAWINADDFRRIRDAGLTHVRLPVGYWAFDVSGGEPFIQGQLPYVQKALDWARDVGLKVIIDLHGAPSSQNGFDNSGQLKHAPEWHLNPSNIERTNAIVKTLAETFSGDSDVVAAIAPLNEPAGFFGEAILNVTKQYWTDSYNTIRAEGDDVMSLIHDAFQPLSFWTDFQSGPEFINVGIDVHKYQVFSDDEVRMTRDQHIEKACQVGAGLNDTRVIVGEWSNAITDCAKHLNSRGSGARFDGTLAGSRGFVGDCGPVSGSSSSWSEDYKQYLRKYWEAQATAYERSQGWIFWTWKTESVDDWSYSKGLEGGWIPTNPLERLFPNICDGITA